MIELRSDNAAGVAPEILAAIEAANVGSALAYGEDDLTAGLHDVVREVFEHPTARVFPVTSGTAANALSLSSLTPPWGAVLCHPTAHIITAEGGSTSLFGAGAVMQGVDGEHALIDPDRLRARLDATRWGDPHESQPSVLSLTVPSDDGTLYQPTQIAELVEIARASGLKVHVDGARLANAVVAHGCSPADLTWRAGVDVLSLGAIKNGALGADAIVAFDDEAADQLVYRTKRSGHVTSKMRFQSAQLTAYLTDGLWLRLADACQPTDVRAGGRADGAGRRRAALAGAGRRQHGVRGAPGRRGRRAPGRRHPLLPDDRHQCPSGHELADHDRRGRRGRSPVPRSGSRRHVIRGSDL